MPVGCGMVTALVWLRVVHMTAVVEGHCCCNCPHCWCHRRVDWASDNSMEDVVDVVIVV